MQNRPQKFVFLSFALLSFGTAFGANVTLGSANNGNCYPFNCNDSGSPTGQSIEYQQVFSGTQFGSSPISITTLTFSDQLFPGFGLSNVPLLSGTYRVSFAITNKTVGGLSTTLANNITSGQATFSTIATPGVGAGFAFLTLNGSTPYVYNPASGNLLLDIVVTNQANVSGASYSPVNGFDADDTGTVTSRAYQIGRSPGVADSTGLVTSFGFNALTTQTPEPNTYALIAAGLLGLIGWKKRNALVRRGSTTSGAIALAVVVAAGLPSHARAQALQISPRTIAIPQHSLGGIPAPDSTSAIINTVPTFSRTYTIGGTPYPQTFVGTDPASTNITTNITVPVVPVIIVLNAGAGPTYDPTAKLNTAPGGSALSATFGTLTSPLFQNANYTTGGTNVGNGIQFGDAIMRATFWDSVSTTSPDWHTVLKFQLKPAVTLVVPVASGAPSGPFAIVDINWLGPKLDAIAPRYGAGNFALFLLYEVLETDNGSCCILGFHTALQIGANLQTYGVGTYLDPGQIGGGAADISVLSHEVAEWLNDPFVNNTVPPWPAPFSFIPPGPPYTAGQCQNNLETGDPIEDRSDPAIVYFNSTTFGRQYTLQNEALAPWFLRSSPSFSVNGYYTFLGPIDSEFAGPAPACPSLL